MKNLAIALLTRVGTALATMVGTVAALTPTEEDVLVHAVVILGLVGVDILTDMMARNK